MNKIGTVAGASIAAFALGATVAGGMAIANADDNGSKPATGMRMGGHHRGPGPGEIVTGADAQKAIAAATAAVPGTGEHVHKVPDGTYRVLVTTADGNHVVVSLDADFTVTGQQQAPSRPGHRGTPASAEEAARVTEAVLASEPGASVQFVEKRADGKFEAHFTTADGARKEAHLDADFTITSIEDDHGPGHHGTPASTQETAKVTEAIQSRLPNATVEHVMKREDSGFAAMVIKANGSKRLVLLTADYTIERVEKAPRHRGGPRGKDVTGPAYRRAARSAKTEVRGSVMDVHRVGKKYRAMVRKDNGHMVLVHLDSDFDVVTKQKLGFPGPGGHGPGRPGFGA